MDWKNKHFKLEAVFPAPRDMVLAAARAFAAESLAAWQIADTPDGFEARGSSFFHAATAKFRIEPASGGTNAAVELLVERASPLGFMLFDIGGYYDAQLRKWFDGIQLCLYQRLISGVEHQSADKNKAFADWRPDWKSKRSGFERVIKTLVIVWTVIFCLFLVIMPVIGLVSGNLYLPLGGDGGFTIHGPWARTISGLILMIAGFLVWKVKGRAHAQSGFPAHET
jgi:hypothetical protein